MPWQIGAPAEGKVRRLKSDSRDRRNHQGWLRGCPQEGTGSAGMDTLDAEFLGKWEAEHGLLPGQRPVFVTFSDSCLVQGVPLPEVVRDRLAPYTVDRQQRGVRLWLRLQDLPLAEEDETGLPTER